MRNAILATILLVLTSGAVRAQTENGRWAAEAARVTITRDDHGIAHVHGVSDADAVFGASYAQAEDDFNRVEMNYLTALGRTAEANGEGAVWTDLRRRLFIDPDVLKADYAKSPPWLQVLMIAWADGLNDYLATHPSVTPKVIRHFEPWMALSFTEGSIGGDDERVGLNALAAFYGSATPVEADEDTVALAKDPTGSNGIAVAPMDTVNGHALLLINPHTSFFFRSELAMTSDAGPERLRRLHLGPVLHLPGLQRPRRLDAHLHRRRHRRRLRRDDRPSRRQAVLPLRRRGAAGSDPRDHHPLS